MVDIEATSSHVRSFIPPAGRKNVALAGGSSVDRKSPVGIGFGNRPNRGRGGAEVIPGSARFQVLSVPWNRSNPQKARIHRVRQLERDVVAPTLALADNRDRMVLVMLLLVIGWCGSAAIHPNVADHRGAVYEQLMAVPDHITGELWEQVGGKGGPHLLARSGVEALNASVDRGGSRVGHLEYS